MNDSDVRRDIPRLSIAMRASFEWRGDRWTGVAVNISKMGLCLRTVAPLEEGDQLALVLTSPSGIAVHCTGIVRWIIELSPLVQPMFPFEVGLAIVEPSIEYDELFSTNAYTFTEYREGQRVTHLIRVELVGPGFWETTFALNLGRRGLFIKTEQHLAPGQLVEVRMQLPGSDQPISLKASVVHVLDEERCRAVGAEPGIGVRFISVPSGFRERYDRFMDDISSRNL